MSSRFFHSDYHPQTEREQRTIERREADDTRAVVRVRTRVCTKTRYLPGDPTLGEGGTETTRGARTQGTTAPTNFLQMHTQVRMSVMKVAS